MESTFQNSKLKVFFNSLISFLYSLRKTQWEEVHDTTHAPILQLYKALLRIRLQQPAFANSAREAIGVDALDQYTVLLARGPYIAVFHLKDKEVRNNQLLIMFMFTLFVIQGAYDLAKLVKSGQEKLEIVLTTEDEMYASKNEESFPPVLENHVVHFPRASAILLRVVT